MILIGWGRINLFTLVLALFYASASAQNPIQDRFPLEHCGRVVAHELGVFEFQPAIYCRSITVNDTCPAQIDAIRAYNQSTDLDPQKTIRYLKITLRTLKDGTWVVAESDLQFYTEDGKGKSLRLSELTSPQFDAIRKCQSDKHCSQFSVYRLKAYTDKDAGYPDDRKMCYMLNTKSFPNENLLADINAQGINDRSVIEVRGANDQAIWINNHSADRKIYFSGVVTTPTDLDSLTQAIKQYQFKNLAFIEVNAKDTKAYAPALIKRINGMGYVSELDSMPYTKLDEWFFSGCAVPMDQIGSTITMTSRPVQCLYTHNNTFQ